MASFKVADASEYLTITGWVVGVKLAKKAWVWVWVWMKMFLFTLLFGSLSLSAQGGRPQLLNARSFTANNTINSKSFDESKITLIFCSWGKCDFFGHGLHDCYCCPDGSWKEYCHQTMEECRANCALCRPKC